MYLSGLQLLGHFSFLRTLMTVIHSWSTHVLQKRDSWYWAHTRKCHVKTKMKCINLHHAWYGELLILQLNKNHVFSYTMDCTCVNFYWIGPTAECWGTHFKFNMFTHIFIYWYIFIKFSYIELTFCCLYKVLSLINLFLYDTYEGKKNITNTKHTNDKILKRWGSETAEQYQTFTTVTLPCKARV